MTRATSGGVIPLNVKKIACPSTSSQVDVWEWLGWGQRKPTPSAEDDFSHFRPFVRSIGSVGTGRYHPLGYLSDPLKFGPELRGAKIFAPKINVTFRRGSLTQSRTSTTPG